MELMDFASNRRQIRAAVVSSIVQRIRFVSMLNQTNGMGFVSTLKLIGTFSPQMVCLIHLPWRFPQV